MKKTILLSILAWILAFRVESHMIATTFNVESFPQDDSYTTYRGDLIGNYNIDQNYIIDGDVTGNITILSVVKVIVSGDIHGNITLQPGIALLVEGDQIGNINT